MLRWLNCLLLMVHDMARRMKSRRGRGRSRTGGFPQKSAILRAKKVRNLSPRGGKVL